MPSPPPGPLQALAAKEARRQKLKSSAGDMKTNKKDVQARPALFVQQGVGGGGLFGELGGPSRPNQHSLCLP